MRILHLCLSASYIEGLSYQENLLSQYHKKMGYEVNIISSLKTFNQNGEYTFANEPRLYVNKYGIKVKTLPYKNPQKMGRLFRTYCGTYEALVEANPDIIFMHGVQFVDAGVVVRYMKSHPNVVMYADNHSDYSNSASNWISKNIQHKILWRYYAQKLNPYVRKFYGVLPARVDFLVDLYHLPKEKVELLVMGADDELVEAAAKLGVRESIRKMYSIETDDFLVMTGGKIDQWKRQTLLLMDAVNEINDAKVNLIVFGSVTPELKDEVNKRCSDKVKYIGWIKSEDSYAHFAAADLVCFPGRHSVFWEQVAGQAIPMLVKYWDGTTHISISGNVDFLYEDATEEIKNKLIRCKENYKEMKDAAIAAASNFSYQHIAEKCIEYKV